MDEGMTPAQKRKLPEAVKKAKKFRDHLWKIIGAASIGGGFLIGEPTRGDLLGVINAFHTALIHALIGAELPVYKPIKKLEKKAKAKKRARQPSPPPGVGAKGGE